MKKIVLLIVIIFIGLLFNSCKVADDTIDDPSESPRYSDNEPSETPRKDDPVEIDEKSKEILEDFMLLIDNWEKPYEVKMYVDREIKNTSTTVADKMLLTFEELQKIYEQVFYQRQFFNSDYADDLNAAAQFGMGRDIIKRIDDEAFKSLLAEIFNGGYKLTSRKDITYPIIDYSLYRDHSEYLSAPVKKYIDFMVLESEKAAVVDAKLTVGWDEIAHRILNLEEFMNSNPDFVRNESLEDLRNNYLKTYLYGVPNSPAFNTEGKYNNVVIRSYNKMINGNKNSESAKTVETYLDILKANDYMHLDETKNFPLPENNYTGGINYIYIKGLLASLLPDNEGYKWFYNGFAEYGHQMTLEQINAQNGEIEYIITGRVEDMSGGDSGRPDEDFQINLSYVLKPAVLIQNKDERMMMDSEMDSLEIIRAPLIKGYNWLQIAQDKSGNDRYMYSEITDINEEDGAKIYTVEYWDQNGEYYERRTIKEGVGVISFAKLWKSEDESYEIGYSINAEASGN